MTSGQIGYRRVLADIAAYTAARLVLLVVLVVVIYGAGVALGLRDFPLLVAAMLALVVSMPLGMWVFAPLRRRATASMALADQRRQRERAELQKRLRGETPKE